MKKGSILFWTCQHDDADDAEEAHDDGIKDHQLGFYQGELKRLVARAIVYMRLFY